MSEKHYTFIKEGRVENTLVFAGKDDELAQNIVDENDYDSFIWLDEKETPHRWSSYDEKTKEFTEPTVDYLISIEVLTPDPIDSTPTS